MSENCFVIMPFAPEFDDVYEAVRDAFSRSMPSGGRCLRLDDVRVAGRITDRLIAELRSASICVADVSGLNPNVMWEAGFVSALSIPTIFLSQDIRSLPFDIKDMQCISYSRERLGSTLRDPLALALADTIEAQAAGGQKSIRAPDLFKDQIAEMASELGQLKAMVSEVVGAWRAATPESTGNVRSERIVGDWFNEESGSYMYVRLVDGKIIAPYCYGGDSSVTGFYSGWKRVGEFWFAEYKWIAHALTGFTFLREDGDRLIGAWWSSDNAVPEGGIPPKSSGVPSTWKRIPGKKTPSWALKFFREFDPR